MNISDSQFISDDLAQITVQNSGEEASGQVIVVVQWYDGQGNFIGADGTQLPTLAAKEAWLAWVQPSIYYSDDITDFTAIHDFDPIPPSSKENMAIADSEFSEEEGYITGTLENGTVSRTSASLIGKIHDSNGWVIGWGRSRENNIPAAADWRFAIPVHGVHTELSTSPQDHSIIVTD